jgi:glycerol-3-phosphate cytidylyltransferase
MLASETSQHWQKGYVSGSFDLFHIGHLHLLRRAKERCDYLLVGVLTDELICERKGKLPIIPLAERLAIIEAIRYVDQVEVTTPELINRVKAWERFRFDAFFTGDDHMAWTDWRKDERELRAVGADLVFFPYTKEQSTTRLRGILST